MPKRLIDTDLWNNEEIIENFTAEDKYFWLYLLTSPHNNICGVFKNSPNLIARDMGLHKDTIVNLLYRFENVHNLIATDKETNEVLILNWYKFNWTKSPKITTLIEKEIGTIKSTNIKQLLEDRISIIFNDKYTVSIPYPYPTNTNSISNNIYNKSDKDNNIIGNDKIREYFDKTYELYPRKVSKVQARTTYEHKLRGLTKEEAKDKANKIYVLLKRQIEVWANENDGQGRKTEHIPYMSSWLNGNVDDSKKTKGR
jgi:hypothetical protein